MEGATPTHCALCFGAGALSFTLPAHYVVNEHVQLYSDVICGSEALILPSLVLECTRQRVSLSGSVVGERYQVSDILLRRTERSAGHEMHAALHSACTFRALDTLRSGTPFHILPYSLVTSTNLVPDRGRRRALVNAVMEPGSIKCGEFDQLRAG
jgi:hypothetical protein